jgi:hypothetical protein
MMNRRLASPAILALALVTGCFAQTPSELRLRVTDGSGAYLSGAHVVIRANARKVNVSDLLARATEDAGEYSAELVPGIYDVFVSAPCVMPFVTQVEAATGKREILPVQMKPQYDVHIAYLSGCPGRDDFRTPIDFDLYTPELPDHIPLCRRLIQL